MVGVDFGTSSTKVVWQDLSENYFELFRWRPELKGPESVLLPSTICASGRNANLSEMPPPAMATFGCHRSSSASFVAEMRRSAGVMVLSQSSGHILFPDQSLRCRPPRLGVCFLRLFFNRWKSD